MIDPLDLLLPHVDSADARFSKNAFAPWSPDAFQQLVRAHLLRPAELAEFLRCPDCGDHVEEVMGWPGTGGYLRFYIPCPQTLWVEVPPQDLEQWAIATDTLAQKTADALALGGKCVSLVPDRLWRLGRTKWQGTLRDVLFVRGLDDHDTGLVSHVTHATRPIVLVPDRIPPAELWPGRIPPIISLAGVASLAGDRIEIDHEAVSAAVLADDRSQPDSGLVGERRLKQLIRQQVKAEEKSQLTDDVLVAAYRQEGTVRKAAEFLSRSTGQAVSKDQVQRAVRRAGGGRIVVRGDDSGSVVRSVLSQRRDKTKKILRQAESVDCQ